MTATLPRLQTFPLGRSFPLGHRVSGRSSARTLAARAQNGPKPASFRSQPGSQPDQNRRFQAAKRQNSLGPRGTVARTPDSECIYFTSTVAPASVNFFLMVSASSFDTPSFTVLGAPSTRSLASFRPRLVTSRTALITLILFAPAAVRTTVNSVFSSAGAAPVAAAPPPATITGAAA